MDINDMGDIMADMAELDLGLPFAAFQRVALNPAISDETGKLLFSLLTDELEQFKANQVEYYAKAFNA